MTSNDNLDLAERQSKQELDDKVSQLIEKWKNMSLDEDSDDDFDPDHAGDIPEYQNMELWQRRRYRWQCKKTVNSKNFEPLACPRPISFDEKYKKVAPEFLHSVLVTSPDHWDIGSLMTCEKIEPGYDVPPDIVCQWVDEGSTYCLRKRSVPKSEPGDGDPEPGKLYNTSTRGIWTLSPNVFCKIQRWVEGVTTDAQSIRFVNKEIPSIPTEEIIYDWIDHDWYRWFMLSRRVPGTRLFEAWPRLSFNQRLQVAEGVAKHAKALARYHSEYIATVTGQGVEGVHRLGLRDDLPEWKPRIEPRASRKEVQELHEKLSEKSDIVLPDIGDVFVLQHSDLTPGNIFVTVPEDPEEEAKVTAIIDWQQLSYNIEWHAATIPRGIWSYIVYNQVDGNDWQWMLSNALYDEGFPLEIDYLRQKIRQKRGDGIISDLFLPWDIEGLDREQLGLLYEREVERTEREAKEREAKECEAKEREEGEEGEEGEEHEEHEEREAKELEERKERKEREHAGIDNELKEDTRIE